MVRRAFGTPHRAGLMSRSVGSDFLPRCGRAAGCPFDYEPSSLFFSRSGPCTSPRRRSPSHPPLRPSRSLVQHSLLSLSFPPAARLFLPVRSPISFTLAQRPFFHPLAPGVPLLSSAMSSTCRGNPTEILPASHIIRVRFFTRRLRESFSGRENSPSWDCGDVPSFSDCEIHARELLRLNICPRSSSPPPPVRMRILTWRRDTWRVYFFFTSVDKLSHSRDPLGSPCNFPRFNNIGARLRFYMRFRGAQRPILSADFP